MAVYTNNLKLKEIADGAESGSWGASTNTNLDLIAQAFGYGSYNGLSSDANATVTVQNSGATEEFTRSMYVKITSSATLSTTRTLTIAPNDISRVLFIENATTGSQTINISQGSGANVAIASGRRKCVYLDGAGSGAAVVEVFDTFDFKDSLKVLGTSIGTFTPTTGASNLIIEDTSDAGISIMTANDAVGRICFGHPSDPDEGQISYTHDSDDTMTFTAGAEFTFKKGSTTQAVFNSGGDLDIRTANKGILLKSANGTQYRVTVSNAGALVVTAT